MSTEKPRLNLMLGLSTFKDDIVNIETFIRICISGYKSSKDVRLTPGEEQFGNLMKITKFSFCIERVKHFLYLFMVWRILPRMFKLNFTLEIPS